jgi:hypothetical protein
MDPTGNKEEGMTWAVMAGRYRRGNEEKGDEGRRRPGPDTLEERIGKAEDSRISPYINMPLIVTTRTPFEGQQHPIRGARPTV